MVAGIAAKREDRAGLGAVVRAQAAVHKAIIAPGAILVVLSGLILTFSVSGRTGELVGFNVWLVVMQGAGLVGALMVLLIGLPTAAKLARLGSDGAGGGVLRRAPAAAADRRVGVGGARAGGAGGGGVGEVGRSDGRTVGRRESCGHARRSP